MKIAVLAKGKRGDMVERVLWDSQHELVMLVHQEKTSADFNVSLPSLIKKSEADLVILAGWSRKVSKEIIDIPSKGVINLHGGKVPEYRGASVLNWQIIQGETAIGLTILYVTPDNYDAGAVIVEDSFPLLPDMSITEVRTASLRKFIGMLRFALGKIERGMIENTRNDWARFAPWPKRKPEDSLIKFSETTDRDAFNFIRALGGEGYPPAFAYGRGKKFHFWKAKTFPLRGFKVQPGRFVGCWSGEGILIGTRIGAVLVSQMWNEEKEEPYSASLIDLPIGTLFSEKGGC